MVFADDIDPLFEDVGPTVKVIYQVIYKGETPIKNAIDAKSASTASILKEETDKIMKLQKYPYSITSGKTEIKIVKYRCDEKMGICGYWIEAWRDGKEVYTNSPIWITVRPDGYEIVISESFDEKVNELTYTVKEDPKLAIEQMLQRYVNSQPLGKAIVGTKE